MRKDHFTDEALKAAYALAELKYSENPEDQMAFEEAYDFARCQRPDGSFYGTSGQCRKGKDAGAKPQEPKKAARRGQAKTALQAEQDRQNAARANRPAPKPGSPAAKAIEAAREDLRKERGVPKPGSPAAKAIEAAREDLRKERGVPKPGSPAAKAIEAAREDLRKERGAPKPGSPAAKAIESAKKDIKAEAKVGDREKLLKLRSKRDNLKANLEKDGSGNPMVRRILNEEIAKTNKQIDRVKKKVPKTPQAQALNKARNEVQSRFNKMAEELKKAEGKEFYRIQAKMRNMINTMERISNTYRKMAKAGRDV